MTTDLPRDYRILRGCVRFLTRVFFREIACEGVDRIPLDRGGLVVAWHPNGLVDPALIMANFPGRIVFGARHGLFKWPILGSLMRRLGTVPIYRSTDRSDKNREARKKVNERSLENLAAELARGSYSALFPEGLSHDLPHLSDIKTGAARLYYRAVELAGSERPTPVIIPVGLHYDRKDIFRSRVLISFHEPIDMPASMQLRPGVEAGSPERRELCRALTDKIEEVLIEVVRVTEDWGLHHLMHRLRKLLRAERADRAGRELRPPTIAERELGFARVWYAYRMRRNSHPEEIRLLKEDLSRYDRDLRAIGLEDHELTQNPRLMSPLWVVLSVLQFVAVFLLIPPVLLIGYVINVVPYYLLRRLARLVSKEPKDVASAKILGGVILFPLTWGIAAYLAAKAHHELHLMFPTIPDIPITAAVMTVVLAVAGGVLALVYGELSAATLRALRVRMTRRSLGGAVARLRQERARVYESVEQLTAGLPLPGRVADDGRIVAEGDSAM